MPFGWLVCGAFVSAGMLALTFALLVSYFAYAPACSSTSSSKWFVSQRQRAKMLPQHHSCPCAEAIGATDIHPHPFYYSMIPVPQEYSSVNLISHNNSTYKHTTKRNAGFPYHNILCPLWSVLFHSHFNITAGPRILGFDSMKKAPQFRHVTRTGNLSPLLPST